MLPRLQISIFHENIYFTKFMQKGHGFSIYSSNLDLHCMKPGFEKSSFNLLEEIDSISI
jgi:hypothetical protein